MADINRVLFTAKEALLSNLTAINVTGSNIANVNTAGYTRLRPIFESVGAKDASSNQEQIGVKIADVERIYDKFLDAQIVDSNSMVSNYTAQKDLLQQIEGVLNESSDNGINDALTKFWNAWGNLSVDPSSKAKRDTVVSTAQNLSSIFAQRAEDLTSIQTDTDNTISDTVDSLNGYLTDMATLNTKIVSTESSGGNASAERDKRGELLTKISSLIDVNYIEQSDGSMYIYLPTNGKTLVQEGNSWQLQVQRNANNNNLYDIVFQEDPSHAITNEIKGGKLAGLIAIRDKALPSYLDQFNQTATSIVNKVNDQHMLGYDQDGNPGGLFFDPVTEAKFMGVSDQIVADSTKIAASSTVGADGNNATLLTALRDDKMYASIGTITSSVPGNRVTGQINNIGQAYKNSTSIVLARGATVADWAVSNNGGYSLLSVLTADAKSVTLDLNGNGTADIKLNLSGTWNTGDTMTFSMTKNASTTNIDDYFNSFIANVGQDVVNASQSLETNTAIATQQSTQREQLSGVSLDEEMMNLIKYQMAYNAAGRMTKTVTELMDILMSLGQ